MVIVGLPYSETPQFTLEEISGGSPHGASTITVEQEYPRPRLRANLLAAFSANRKHEDGSIRLFELVKAYITATQGLA